MVEAPSSPVLGGAAPGRGGMGSGSACRPGSVPPLNEFGGGGDHPSATTVAGRLVRSTRMLGRAALERILSDLAPGGVCLAAPVARRTGGLLHHRFTLTDLRRVRRSVLCGTFPRVTPGGCCPPPCPAEPGPSSAPVSRRTPRSPGQLLRKRQDSDHRRTGHLATVPPWSRPPCA